MENIIHCVACGSLGGYERCLNGDDMILCDLCHKTSAAILLLSGNEPTNRQLLTVIIQLFNEIKRVKD